MAITLNKGLKHYNDIYKRLDDATPGELAEAKAYFDSIGGEFKSKSKKIDEKLSKFTQTDLFKDLGVNEEEFVFDADTTFLVKEVTNHVTDIDEKAIFAQKPYLDGKYFKTVTKEVLDVDLIMSEFDAGTLPALIKPHVNKYSQTSLTMKKKPKKRTSTKKISKVK